MQSDFESWHSVMLREVHENNENGASNNMNERSPQSRFVKDAWSDSAKGVNVKVKHHRIVHRKLRN